MVVETAIIPADGYLQQKQKPIVEKVETGIFTSGKATRVIEIYNEDESECITLGASGSTKIPEICDIISSYTKIDPDKIQIVAKVGCFPVKQRLSDEIASRVIAMGVKSFKRGIKKYEHPVLIIGAGLGGLQTLMMFLQSGRKDLICVEKLHDVGGHSWHHVANKFTKLQTERGTYHLDYIFPEKPVPTEFDGLEYKTWPSRDQLLKMFTVSAREHGLYEYIRFFTEVHKVKPLPDGSGYAVHTAPVKGDEEGELMITSAVSAWPGNLCHVREITWPGEDDFGGYIEYASFCKCDYRKAEGKNCILYGHGAFTIENVRTLVEHKCKKVFVMCRKRNLCGMKVVSWMVGSLEVPMPGPIMLDAMQVMYDLVGFDVWSAYSVKTDAKRSFAHVSQKTVFGVTDVYFLAGYYGLMDVVVDEIKRLTNGCAQTKKGKKIKCDVIVKAVGTVPDFAIDKMLGLKEMVGIWCNGDPRRPVACNGMFVEARNFGSFSSGPGFGPLAKFHQWFIDYPEDFDVVKDTLPKKKSGEMPCYVPGATHMLPIFTAMGPLPMLQAQLNVIDACKAAKQKASLPTKKYVADCRAEWEAYIQFFKKEGMVDDRPEPPYPYTEEFVEGVYDRVKMEWMRKAGMVQ